MRLALLLLAIGPVLLFDQANSIPAAYAQPYRPQYHFSPREHWMNDPNGLVYFDGEYHLFFQYNPFNNQWGHMTWGHAVSSDLVHWKEMPPAIPEENGIMIFTGSAVVDEQNTSGFCTNHKPCLVAIYTGHTPERSGHPALQTQNLAFSNDHGRTWTKYSGNPVLNLRLSDFRDPNVFWSRQTSRWVMVVSLPNDHKVRIYESRDLKQWTALSEFGPEGATGGQWECPDLFELPVEGGKRETRWILKIGLNPGALQGGSGEQYFIGRFDGKRFINDNPASQTMWTDYGKDCYCSLAFNNLPRGNPTVMIGWMSNWQYARDLPTSPWRGQMMFPRRLSLGKTPEGLRLVQAPIDQLRLLKQTESQATGKTGTLEMVNRWLAGSELTTGRTFQLETEIGLGGAREVGLRILMSKGSYTAISYDRQAQKLFFDRTHSGSMKVSQNFASRIEAPLVVQEPVLRLNMLVDRNSVEIFANDGRLASTNLVFPLADANGIEVYAEGGHAGKISARITPIQSIWTIAK